MNKYDYLEEMSDSEQILFKKSIRKLLDATFIVKDKDEKLYQFIARGSNRENISEYLRLIGYNLNVSDEQGVAMLYQDETDDENVGLKRTNLQSFDGTQVKFLLVLWQAYLTQCSYENEVYLTVGEIIDKLRYYGITAELNQTSFKDTMIMLRKYSLIDFRGNDFTEELKIRLYPSLMFCMDLDQLKQVIRDYISDADYVFEEPREDEEEE
ncbi:MAG: DUF4194 domain-containing protein [Erysipelotrichaceae bacterium]|nr:DUF4194 domain-containing protein [Erysipelotrichaceae bacterium]